MTWVGPLLSIAFDYYLCAACAKRSKRSKAEAADVCTAVRSFHEGEAA